jgi:hypothetical protein
MGLRGKPCRQQRNCARNRAFAYQVAMAKSSRSAPPKLARQALVLARLATKIDSGRLLTEDEVIFAAAGVRPTVERCRSDNGEAFGLLMAKTTLTQ